MVKVKLFGLLRLDTGLRELELEAKTVRELYPQLLEAAHRANPAAALSMRDIRGCIISVNGRTARKSTPLAPGDTVMLFSPACGG